MDRSQIIVRTKPLLKSFKITFERRRQEYRDQTDLDEIGSILRQENMQKLDGLARQADTVFQLLDILHKARPIKKKKKNAMPVKSIGYIFSYSILFLQAMALFGRSHEDGMSTEFARLGGTQVPMIAECVARSGLASEAAQCSELMLEFMREHKIKFQSVDMGWRSA